MNTPKFPKIKVDKIMEKHGYFTLPKRVFQSPLIEYANFADNSFVNLIRLVKPYANGNAYAVYETTQSNFCHSKMYKTYDQAKTAFESIIVFNQNTTALIERNITGNGIFSDQEEKGKCCLFFQCTSCGNKWTIIAKTTNEKLPCPLCTCAGFGMVIHNIY